MFQLSEANVFRETCLFTMTLVCLYSIMPFKNTFNLSFLVGFMSIFNDSLFFRRDGH